MDEIKNQVLEESKHTNLVYNISASMNSIIQPDNNNNNTMNINNNNNNNNNEKTLNYLNVSENLKKSLTSLVDAKPSVRKKSDCSTITWNYQGSAKINKEHIPFIDEKNSMISSNNRSYIYKNSPRLDIKRLEEVIEYFLTVLSTMKTLNF